MDSDNVISRPILQSRIAWKYVRDGGETKMPINDTNVCNSIATVHRNGMHSKKEPINNVKFSEDLSNHKSLFEVIHPIKVPIIPPRRKSILSKIELDNPAETAKNNCKEIKKAVFTDTTNTENTRIKIKDAKQEISQLPENHNHRRKSDIQQSPESQKKDELCSYLQLIKTTDTTQDNILLKERRSARVKNLQLLTEKKNSEKNLKHTDNVQSSSKSDTSITTSEDKKRNPSPENVEGMLLRKLRKRRFKYLSSQTNTHNVKIKKSKNNGQVNKHSLNNSSMHNKLQNWNRKFISKRKSLNNRTPKKYTKEEINEIILGKNQQNKTATSFANRIIWTRNLRSRVQYKDISMKQFMKLLEIQEYKRKYKQKYRKETKKSKKSQDDMSRLPLLEHNYAMCNGCSIKHSTEISTAKECTTKEIICGSRYKEKDDLQDPILLQQNSEESKKKTSILKEKLIFNTTSNKFENSVVIPKMKELFVNLGVPVKEIISKEKSSNTTEEKKSENKCESYNEDISTTEDDIQNLNNKTDFQTFFEKQIETLTKTNLNNNIESNKEIKSLYKNLIKPKQKHNKKYDCDLWIAEEEKKATKEKRLSHSIPISKEHGSLFDAIYIENSLIIVQELSISFYEQSPLGLVLGAQNMWIPKGIVQRLLLSNNGCVQKETSLNVINADNSVSYVELWTKEHKSDKRERPVCDVFAAIYFMKTVNKKPDKKVLQLENINAFSDDVKYIVKNTSRDIIVCWKETNNDKTITKIRCYSFECDYQTIAGVMEMQTVNYLITSLHNVEDTDSLLMGFGETKTTLWNLEYGYVVATIDICDIKPQPETLWVKCERGFLFTIQNTHDGNLRLVAIRGMNHSWKQLTSFKSPKEYSSSSLKGICIEHGMLVAFYDNGVLCWNAQTGELLMEAESSNLNYFPSFKHVIITTMGQVIVKHALSYLITV